MAHPAVTDVLTFTGFDLPPARSRPTRASFLTLKDWKNAAPKATRRSRLSAICLAPAWA